MLKLGSRGPAVVALQKTMKRYDPTLGTDGRFGRHTERTVRLAQRRLSVFPADGVVGPRTLAAIAAAEKKSAAGRQEGGWYEVATSLMSRAASGLRSFETDVERWLAAHLPKADDVSKPLRPAVSATRQSAVTAPMPPGTAMPIAGMRTSRSGRRFIITHESLRNVSNRLHWPGGVSGVTLGPGYDMGARRAAAVVRDLTAIGVPPSVASSVSEGAGLTGHDARDFARANKNLVVIDTQQESALLDHIAPHYEAKVKRSVKIMLHQHEFDALVSYAYNPGGGWKKTTKLVNAHQPDLAMAEIARHVRSKHKIVDSLVRRRQHEARLFLYGVYR
jgi:hypothetical protein